MKEKDQNEGSTYTAPYSKQLLEQFVGLNRENTNPKLYKTVDMGEDVPKSRSQAMARSWKGG